MSLNFSQLFATQKNSRLDPIRT